MTEHRHEAVVVTGASSGIGAGAAMTLAQHGFLTFAGVRSDADAARVATLHERIRPLRLDVTEPGSVRAAAETVGAAGRPLRAVVGNAGIALAGPLEFVPIELIRQVFDVNVFGALAVAQAFLPQLRAARGRLVFVGSISGRLSVPFIAPYSASKFALRAFADALRTELRPAGVAVSLVEPGSVRTPIWRKGRDARAALVDMMGPEALARYGPQIETVFAGVPEREERAGMPVEHVSRAILRAVTAAAPRARYVLGAPARAGTILALLPPALRDRALRASMRLP